MNTQKTNSYGRLVAFFLVAVALICALGFAANGWQSSPNNEPDSGDTDKNNGDTDENKDGDQNTEENTEPPIEETKYYNILTGTEVDDLTSMKRPVAFVMDPMAPLYGISKSDILVELPTENGSTRFLSISQGAVDLGKIGSILPTRGYISNFAKYFGAVLVSLGADGEIVYDSADLTGSHFNLADISGYHYTEYSQFAYSNGDLITAGLANSGINPTIQKNITPPFLFSDTEITSPHGSATSISVSYSDASSTEFAYSSLEKKYTLSKSGTEKRDLLNDKSVAFDNLFFLFADSITYESKDATELVMNTSGAGEGYYVSAGIYLKILWSTDAQGNLIFKTENGEILAINRGNSYIGVLKSSCTDNLKFS